MNENIEIDEASYRISLQMAELAQELDKVLEAIAGEKMGFSLVVFGGEGSNAGWTQYASNCARESVKEGFLELIDKWNEHEENIPLHDRATKN